MKRKLLGLVVMMMFCLPQSSLAATDTYFGLKAGVGIVSGEATLNYSGSHDFSEDYSQFGLGFVFGTTLSKMDNVNIRLEVENHMRFGSGEMELDNWGDTVEVKFNNSTLVSLYFDFPVSEKVTPYVGASAGLLIFTYEAMSPINATRYVEETGTGVAFQYGLGAGVAYKATDKVSIDLNVRYLWSTDYNIDYDDLVSWDTDLNQSMADITVGFRYHF